MDNNVYRRVQALYVTVLVLSIATLGVAATLSSDIAVWIRGGIVVVIAVVLIALAKRALAGSRGAYLRMMFMSVIGPLAIVVLILVPHTGFPLWMKGEQIVVGVLLAAAAAVAGRRAVRRTYPKAGRLAR